MLPLRAAKSCASVIWSKGNASAPRTSALIILENGGGLGALQSKRVRGRRAGPFTTSAISLAPGGGRSNKALRFRNSMKSGSR